ncbi:hypothetical protein [Labrys monachus]|uniref:Uncharacterized protein n=1 Tax=Labrys monachus TaxID=217067 RepID=A0ABU0FID8_9HYPH|nr:hypothetical protein [Labrys monachus]MDQ0394375.1 hypothetical protein [Labrys monachus]
MKAGSWLVVAILAAAPFATAVAAQEKNAPSSPSAPCQADPGNGTQAPAQNTDKITRCDGVLKPPSTMDHGMEKQPPRQGDTPVIRPEDVPPQQAPQ